MTTVVEFLLARIAEDETEVRALVAGWEASPPSAYDFAQVGWAEAMEPARVLAECAAKRDLIEWAAGITSLRMMGDPDAPRPVEMDVLKVMACVWADHPDFDLRWRA